MLSIIIPNYNGEENLKKNLPKVILAANKFSDLNSEIIVVDDASTDGSQDVVLNFSNKITLIQNNKNLGFAESCNVGVKKAKGKIIVLLNSDVYPDENFLEFLVPHFQDEKVFAVGCLEKNLDENGKIISEHGVGKLFFKNGIYQHKAGDLNSKETDWVCGGSGAFRKDLFLKLNGFDLRFKPFYWEDIDLSFRAKKMGYKLLFEKNAVVYHQHIRGSITVHFSKEEIEKISFKNQIKFTMKHINSLYNFLLFIIFIVKLKTKNLLIK